MITFKTLTIEDLKKDYSDRKGFVFQGQTPSSDDSCELLAAVLVQKDITKDQPEFVVKLNDMTFLFVYGDDFDTPKFWQRASGVCQMTNSKVETLYNFLKD